MPSVIPSWPRVLASVRAYPEVTIRQGIGQVLRAEPLLQPLINASGGEGRVIEALYTVLRQSILEGKADKAYYLAKLESLNEMAEELSDYLAALVEKSQDLAARERGKEEESYKCSKAQPQSWLAELPVRYIPVPILKTRK